LTAADVVLIAEPSGESCANGGICISEIWKATKPIRISEFIGSYLGHPQVRSLFLITTKAIDGDVSHQIPATVQRFPITEESVVVESTRYRLLDLRIALALKDIKS
jgi:hypothetical protein